MGEIQQHVHHLDPDQFATLVDLLGARSQPASAPAPVRNPLDLGLELWSFHSPSAGCAVVAYVDDHNQVRHVPETRTTDVPAHWRRIWLEDRS